MEEKIKGTVTQLSSLLPAEDVQRASTRVNDTIAERLKELNLVRSFIGDNSNLINLVQKLPDELHHDIMVPFGKAAFFPGRLVHTNEFLVLLGEGYYAERTSKQTVDILRRRENILEAQVESLKAVMQDLKAEASFFDSTAAEVAEGLVEIREEYIEETAVDKVPTTGSSTAAYVEEEEYARMMAKFDELEKEELAAESTNEGEGGEEYVEVGQVDEPEDMQYPVKIGNKAEDDCMKACFEQKRSEPSLDHKHKSPQGNLLNDESEQTEGNKFSKLIFQQDLCSPQGNLLNDESEQTEENKFSKLIFGQDLCSQVQSTQRQVAHEDDSSIGRSTEPAKSNSDRKAVVSPGPKKNDPVEPQPVNKAFTGSVIEHTYNLREESSSSKSTSTATSKPVSRFKLQRR